MSLSPRILLTNSSRQRCISKLKDLPAFLLSKSKPTEDASVLVPICIHNGEVCLLYTLRSAKLKNHGREVSFPGGKVNKNENFVDAALRETEEEIGIPRNSVDIWTTMQQVQGTNMNMAVTPVVGEIRDFELKKLQKNPDEVEEIFLTPMKTFCDTKNQAYWEYSGHTLPIFLHKQHKIWGITGIITNMFLDSFLPEDVFKRDFMRQKYDMNEFEIGRQNITSYTTIK